HSHTQDEMHTSKEGHHSASSSHSNNEEEIVEGMRTMVIRQED
ncbi:7209_t:CDS:2, partial [Scutellospora calospora]